MTKKMIIAFAAGALLSLATSSCSLFTETVKPQAELPSDRENVASPTTPEHYRSAALDRGEISGEWAVVDVASHRANGEITPFLLFDPKTGRVYGNNGCNAFNGSYTVNVADSTLHFSDMVTTMRACEAIDLTEQEINNALTRTRRYTWSVTPEMQYLLSFTSDEGTVLMTLRRQDFDFLNGTWMVKAINGTTVDDPDMKLVIDINELKIHGNTGCNILNGSIVTDMTERNSISFQQLATTQMACPDSRHENELLVALEEVIYARPVSSGECLFLNGQDNVVLDLVRVNL